MNIDNRLILSYVRVFLTVVIAMAFSLQTQAQKEDFPDTDDDKEVTLFKKEKKFKPEKLRVGFFPEFALSSDYYGNTTLFLGINPSVSYQLHKRFEPGLGFMYGYLNVLNIDGAKIHQFGFFQDAKVFVWEGFFVYERAVVLTENNLVARFDNAGRLFYQDNGRRTSGNVFLGGGYDFPIGDRASFSVFIMMNLLTNANFPQRRPHYGMRFSFGLGKR